MRYQGENLERYGIHQGKRNNIVTSSCFACRIEGIHRSITTLNSGDSLSGSREDLHSAGAIRGAGKWIVDVCLTRGNRGCDIAVSEGICGQGDVLKLTSNVVNAQQIKKEECFVFDNWPADSSAVVVESGARNRTWASGSALEISTRLKGTHPVVLVE